MTLEGLTAALQAAVPPGRRMAVTLLSIFALLWLSLGIRAAGLPVVSGVIPAALHGLALVVAAALLPASARWWARITRRPTGPELRVALGVPLTLAVAAHLVMSLVGPYPLRIPWERLARAAPGFAEGTLGALALVALGFALVLLSTALDAYFLQATFFGFVLPAGILERDRGRWPPPVVTVALLEGLVFAPVYTVFSVDDHGLAAGLAAGALFTLARTCRGLVAAWLFLATESLAFSILFHASLAAGLVWMGALCLALPPGASEDPVLIYRCVELALVGPAAAILLGSGRIGEVEGRWAERWARLQP